MPFERRLPLATASLTVLAVLTACGGGGWVRDHPDVADRARSSPGSFVQPAQASVSGVHGLYGSYTVRVSRGVAGRTFDTAIAVRRPDQLDILFLDPTGAIQAYLRSNGVEIGLFFKEDNVLYSGPATREGFHRALGLDLAAADAVAVLLGHGVAGEELPPGLPAWDDQARRVRVDYADRASAWLHPVTLQFDRVLHRTAGGEVRAEIQEWRSAPAPEAHDGSGRDGLTVGRLDGSRDTVDIPSRLRLRVEPDGLSAQLRMLGEPQLNPDFPPQHFDLQVVAGTERRPLADLSGEGGLLRHGIEPESER